MFLQKLRLTVDIGKYQQRGNTTVFKLLELQTKYWKLLTFILSTFFGM